MGLREFWSSHQKRIIAIVIIVLFIICVTLFFKRGGGDKIDTVGEAIEKNPKLQKIGDSLVSTETIADGVNKLVLSKTRILSFTGNVLNLGLRFIFGINVVHESKSYKDGVAGTFKSDSIIVLAIAMWFIFFFLMGDIFELGMGGTSGLGGFVSARKIAFLGTVVLANAGALNGIIGGLMGWMVWLSGLAVPLIFFFALLFYISVHWGITDLFDPIVKQRLKAQMRQEIASARIQSARAAEGTRFLASLSKSLAEGTK